MWPDLFQSKLFCEYSTMSWNFSATFFFFKFWKISDITCDLENIMNAHVAISQPKEWNAADAVEVLVSVTIAGGADLQGGGPGPTLTDHNLSLPACFCSTRRLSGWHSQGRWLERNNSMAHIDKLGASCSPVDQTIKKRLSLCPQNPAVVRLPMGLFISIEQVWFGSVRFGLVWFPGQGPCLSYLSQYLSWYLLLKKSGRHFLALEHNSLEVKHMSSKIRPSEFQSQFYHFPVM